jgi:hypothetical protein
VTSGSKDLEGRVGKHLTVSSQVQAVCDWCGPSDLEKFAEFNATFPGARPDFAIHLITNLVGGSSARAKKVARAANPITYVKADCPPFLIMHGDRDKVVPHEQSDLFAEALRNVGASVDPRIVNGADHDFLTPPNMRIVERFFMDKLGVRPKTGDGEAEPRAIATFAHKAGTAVPGNITLYSNGYVGSPDGPHTWVRPKNGIMFIWYNKKPAGMWVDRCDLSPDGNSYHGTNQEGAIITGTRVRIPE